MHVRGPKAFLARRSRGANHRIGRAASTALLVVSGLSGTLAAVGLSAGPSAAATAAVGWGQATPATAPPALEESSMAFDTATHQLLLVGATATDTSEETWAWTGSTWDQLSPATAPPARAGASLAYDPASGSLVLFGGLAVGGPSGGSGPTTPTYLGDTWTWDGTTWSELTDLGAAPSPREGAGFSYDATSNQLLLFGGLGAGGLLDDTWTFENGSWSELAPTTAPTPRAFSAMAYDPNLKGLLLFGGEESPDYADIWTWDGSNWTQGVNPSALCPSCGGSYYTPGKIGDSAIALDPSANLLLQVGGDLNAPSANPSAYEFDWIADGTFSPTPAPSAREFPAMAYDGDTGQLVLFGGSNGGGSYLNDTWTYGAEQNAGGSSCAGFSDDFTTQSALSSNWVTATPDLTSLATAQGGTFVTPQLSFSSAAGTGLDVAGAGRIGVLTGIESAQSCSGAWTFKATGRAVQSHGNTLALYLVGGAPADDFAVELNLNPSNTPYYGIWEGAGSTATQVGSELTNAPGSGDTYTVALADDGAGNLSGSVTDDTTSTSWPFSASLHYSGPLSFVLGEREGDPTVAGANEALWSSASLAVSAETTSTVTTALAAGAPTVNSVATVPDSALDTAKTTTQATTSTSADPSSAPLASIDLQSSPLASIPLASIPLASISVPGTNAIGQSLSSTLLSDLTIAFPKGCGSASGETACTGWGGVLAGTALANDPLQDVTLAEVLANPTALANFNSVDLGALGLESSPLASIPLASIALGSTPLASIPLDGSTTGASALAAWCSALSSAGYSCAADFGITASSGTTTVTLLDLALAGVPLASIPLGSIPLASIPLASIPLASIPLASIDLTSSPLASIPLASIPLASIPLASIPLASIPLASIGDLAAICASTGSFSCGASGATLGDALAAGAIPAGATLGELGSYGTTTVGEIVGSFDIASPGVTGTTLADLVTGDVTSTPGYPTLTLANVLGGLEPPASYPWSDVDLSSLPLAADESSGGTVSYSATLNVTGPGGAATVTATLPAGFAYVPASAALDGVPLSPTVSGATLSFATSLTGGSHELTFEANAGTGLGQAAASVTATIGSSTSTASTSVGVVDGLAADDTAAKAAPLAPGTLNLGYIGSPGATEDFAITVNAGQELSLDLSNLSEEYDLALFSPAGTALQGTPSQSLSGVTDSLPTLSPAQSLEPTPGSSDIPLTPPTGYSLYALSNNSGGADQTIQTPPLDAGTYIVQVSGYNGATSSLPYLLRAQLIGSAAAQSCQPLAYTTSMAPSSASVPTVPAGANTVFLVDTQRLAAEYGTSAASTVMGDLASVATDTSAGVNGVVVPVDAYASVQAAYATFDANPCSVQAANGVVAAISSVVDGLRSAHPTIGNLVIVGDDDQIPFARLADGASQSNERDYAASTFAGENNVEADALGLGYYFSDDPYGAENPLGVGSATLYTPQLAIGRLVETPAEIESALTRFVSSKGNLDATAGLSTGYSFLSSAAKAVAANLATAGLNPVTQLINETWTHAQLDQALAASPSPAIDSLNAHFDYSRALPAIGNATGTSTDLFTTTDVSSAPAQYAGRLLFSMGCHAGLEIDSAELAESGVATPVADWAKTFADAGALWVANTGYGYGDTSTIAYSAKLMTLFSGALGSGDTIGEALTAAKQQYAAGNAILSPYDLKSLMESTFYGLPMYQLNASPAPTAPTTTPPATTLDGATGLETAPVAVSLPTGSAPGDLSEANGPDGTHYFVVNGAGASGPSVQATEFRPLEPLTTLDVTEPSGNGLGLVAHGALITGLSSSDLSNFSPTISDPIVDSSSNEANPTIGDAPFPGTLERVATSSGFDSSGAPKTTQELDLIAGQFIPDPATPGAGTERLFHSIAADVYYLSPNSPLASDYTPPTIEQSSATTVASTTTFEVTTSDPGAPVKRVVVLYTDAATPGSWSAIDLESGDGSHFSASVPATSSGTVDYVVEAVDAAGNVGFSDNEGTDFASTTGPAPSSAISFQVQGATATNGYYNGPVSVAISAPSGSTYVLDGGPSTPVSAAIAVSGEGVHTLVVSDPTGDSASETIDIATAPPDVLVTTTPLPTNGYVPGAFGGSSGSELVVNATADSPITSVRYSESGAQATSSPVVASAVPLDIPLTANGTTTVDITVTDAAGNSTTTTEVVAVDANTPTVSCDAPPGATPYDANVTVSCTTTDGESGIAANPIFTSFSPQKATFSLSTSVGSGQLDTTASTGTATLCSAVGDCTTVGPFGPYVVDEEAPTITITSPTATSYTLGAAVPVSYECSAPVGVASCTGTAANGGHLATGSVGSQSFTVTATDKAGNTSSVTVAYKVTYAICPTSGALQVPGAEVVVLTLCNARGENVTSPLTKVTAVSIDGATSPVPALGLKGTDFQYLGTFLPFPLFGVEYYAFSTKGLASGAHTLTLSVAGDPVVHSLPFSYSAGPFAGGGGRFGLWRGPFGFSGDRSERL